MYVWIHDHKTIGKDKELSEGEVEVRFMGYTASDQFFDSALQIWRYISSETVSSQEVVVNLKPGGLLRAILEFDPGSNPNGSNGSLYSGEHKDHRDHRSMSFSSPSRFSLRGRRPNDDDSQ